MRPTPSRSCGYGWKPPVTQGASSSKDPRTFYCRGVGPRRELAPWLGPHREAWLADARLWIDEVALEHRLGSVTGVSAIRERRWGAVLRVEAGLQTYFFKAGGPGTWHETRLLADITAEWPHLVPRVVRIDHERSWIFMADDGSAMWDAVDPERQVMIYEDLLPSYAEMQRGSTGSIEAWVDAGVPDRRMERLPDLLRSLLGDLDIDGDLRLAMQGLVPTFERVCDELAAIPGTIDHADLHGGNVLVFGNAHRLVDWGDAQVAHPFGTLLITYQVDFLHRRVDGLPVPDSIDRRAVSRRLRDAYLEPWTDLAPADELRAVFANALWVTHVCRAIDFTKLLEATPLDAVGEWNREIVDLLGDWYERRTLLASDEMLDAVWSGPTR